LAEGPLTKKGNKKQIKRFQILANYRHAIRGLKRFGSFLAKEIEGMQKVNLAPLNAAAPQPGGVRNDG
jgi:hypothetical protein